MHRFSLTNLVLNIQKNFSGNLSDLKNTRLVGRVSTNGPGDLSSIPGRVISKTQKIVLDTSLFNTQHYKVRLVSYGHFY